MRAALIVLACVVGGAVGIYLPGVAPKEYNPGDQVELKVNKISSTASALSYDYYSLPFCRPDKIKYAAENLGEHLSGDTIENSKYELFSMKNESCKVLCQKEYAFNDVKKFVSKIRKAYNVNWLLDNLPAAATDDNGTVIYTHGFPVGDIEPGNRHYFLYNHVKMTVKYHLAAEYKGARIVGFDVHPMSIQSSVADGKLSDCHEKLGYLESEEAMGAYQRMYILRGQMAADAKVNVVWSYDVKWVPSPVQWASRWDNYLSNGNRYSNDEIHWFAIVNSVIIAVFLTGLVAMILVRALYRDFSRYNRVATDEEKAEDKEETGWKLVHADVFRPPSHHPVLFAVLSGVGTQVLGMSLATVFFAAVGFLNPANRGSLMVGIVLLFLLMGAVGGFEAARTHKLFDGKTYQRTTLLVAFAYPGLVFGVVFLLNLFVWHDGSSNAIPFGSMATVLVLWFLVSVPLVFLGAYFGFKREKISVPLAVAALPRPIPQQPFYLNLFVSMLIGGLLPFGTVFVELFFILSSLWLDQYYYLFGFLLLVFVLLAVTVAEISIVLVYFMLCAENHKWWWRSFLAPAASGAYLFLYSVYYFKTRLFITDSTSILLYFGYMFLISTVFSLITGTVGYLSTFVFVKKIYAAIKVD